MAKKKGCNWSGKDWVGVVVSEVTLYLFLWYWLWMLEVTMINQWVGALVSLVLLNIMFFACPVFRKHFM